LANAVHQAAQRVPILGRDEGIYDEAGVAIDQRQEVQQFAQGQIHELMDVIWEEAVEDGQNALGKFSAEEDHEQNKLKGKWHNLFIVGYDCSMCQRAHCSPIELMP
jgi:hypothetical protein